jgi:hypothetical protein
VPIMNSLISLSLADWAKLVTALWLFLGPGYGLLSYYPKRGQFDSTQTIAISFSLSIALWAIMLAWLHGLGIALAPVGAFVILSSGWILGLLRTRPWLRLSPSLLTEAVRGDRSRIALWAILLISALMGIWALRNSVVGPGSDSYHHTLITRMIVDRGMLPDGFQPYAPIVTFTYHFGFHGLAAAISWLTGLSPVTIVPILAQILVAAAALSAAFFAQVTTRSRSVATIAAGIAGLVAVYPSYFINWGRYTQLTGLVILPVLLALLWMWVDSRAERILAPFIGVLAGGLALAHYRVAIMAIIGGAIIVGLNGLSRWHGWIVWRQATWRLVVSASIAGSLTLPWILQLLGAQSQGYRIDLGAPAAAYFSLERASVAYSTNDILIGLTIVAVILGWTRRERVVIVLSLWALAMLILSTPRFAATLMDTVTVIISLYFPVSVAIGWALAVILDWLDTRVSLLRWGVQAGLVTLLAWGAAGIGSIVDPRGLYVQPDDLPAVEWIQSHTPVSSYFMVNTFHWDFLPTFVIGPDAGYWLPLLAGRRTVTAPMIYSNERSSSPDFADRLAALDRLGGNLTSPEALALLRREGITHVYIGQRGGLISAEELIKSPHFKLVYKNNAVHVFEIVAGPVSAPVM